jgi:hypothetical protein
MPGFDSRPFRENHALGGGAPVGGEDYLDSSAEGISQGATMRPINVQQVIDGLKLAESIDEVFQVYAAAKEPLNEMQLVGDNSRWIGEYGFRIAAPADAQNMRQNLNLCQELNLTCAPRLVEIIEIPDQTAVVVLMLPGGAGRLPRQVTREDSISPAIVKRYVDSVGRLGERGFVNIVSTHTEEWLLHPISGDIILEDWSCLWSASKSAVAGAIKEIESYF